MKAVIVEINKKDAIVLTKSGEFIKIKNESSFELGKEVDITQQKKANPLALSKIAGIAAIIIFIVFAGFVVLGYNLPYSYVYVDINPSIELVTNIFDRIIDSRALNDDAVKILNSSSIKNKKINDGIITIVKGAAQSGYFEEESDNAILISIICENENKVRQLINKAQEVAEKEVQEAGIESLVSAQTVNVEQKKRAHELKVSPGKLNLVEKFIELRPGTSFKEASEMPVKELVKTINEVKVATRAISGDEKVLVEQDINNSGGEETDKDNSYDTIQDNETDKTKEKEKNKNKDIKDDKKEAGKDQDKKANNNSNGNKNGDNGNSGNDNKNKDDRNKGNNSNINKNNGNKDNGNQSGGGNGNSGNQSSSGNGNSGNDNKKKDDGNNGNNGNINKNNGNKSNGNQNSSGNGNSGNDNKKKDDGNKGNNGNINKNKGNSNDSEKINDDNGDIGNNNKDKSNGNKRNNSNVNKNKGNSSSSNQSSSGKDNSGNGNNNNSSNKDNNGNQSKNSNKGTSDKGNNSNKGNSVNQSKNSNKGNSGNKS